MYKIGVIGPRQRIACFMAAGFHIYEADSAEEASAALKKAKNESCAVIYIVPSLAAEIEEDIQKLSREALPAVSVLPEAGGGMGIKQLSRAVERAVGADIVFKEK